MHRSRPAIPVINIIKRPSIDRAEHHDNHHLHAWWHRDIMCILDDIVTSCACLMSSSHHVHAWWHRDIMCVLDDIVTSCACLMSSSHHVHAWWHRDIICMLDDIVTSSACLMTSWHLVHAWWQSLSFPILITSNPYHFQSLSLPILITSNPYHFQSLSLPILITFIPYHFQSLLKVEMLPRNYLYWTCTIYNLERKKLNTLLSYFFCMYMQRFAAILEKILDFLDILILTIKKPYHIPHSFVFPFQMARRELSKKVIYWVINAHPWF